MAEMHGLLASKGKEYLLVLLCFLIMAILVTWPLILHIHDGIPGDAGFIEDGDCYGIPSGSLHASWIVAWDAKTVFTDITDIFQANTFYPSRDSLAFSEYLILLGIIGAPVYHLTHNPVLTYNLLLLLGMIFSAFGCYLLIKELTGSRWGGMVGGLFFAYCPYHLARPDHLWLAFSVFLPFMLLYLYRFLAGDARKHLVLFALFFLAQSLVGWHYSVFCALAAGLLWLWSALFTREREGWGRLA
ncbi:MAG: hypothetical protein SWK76_12725 [Actinomycetota bacterium]|nr:hypothetical protein [Actinomycetota bacterium]